VSNLLNYTVQFVLRKENCVLAAKLSTVIMTILKTRIARIVIMIPRKIKFLVLYLWCPSIMNLKSVEFAWAQG
jgi:hypothetical protein